MERKDSCSYLPRDDQSMGNFGMAKTFLICFLLRPSALLSLGRVRILFPSANCPSGEWKIFVLRGCLRTPSGQKFFTLPQDNWPQETKFLLSLRTTKAFGLRRKKNQKSFCHPSVPPSFGISCQIKSTFFFSYVHTIFFQRWIEFFQLTRLLLYIWFLFSVSLVRIRKWHLTMNIRHSHSCWSIEHGKHKKSVSEVF